MFLGLPDSLVRGTDPAPDPPIINKKYSSKKNCFFDFLSLKNDVNVSSKSNEQKNFLKN
jgi:hypothetical protein